MSVRRYLASSLNRAQVRHYEEFLEKCFGQAHYRLDTHYFSHVYVSSMSLPGENELPPAMPVGLLCVRLCNYLMMLRDIDLDCKRLNNGSSVEDMKKYFPRPSTCDITFWNLCVAPESRRRKIAEHLMLSAMSDCLRDHASDFDTIRFQLYVHEENQPAIKLYNKLGFEVDSRDERNCATLIKMAKSFVTLRSAGTSSSS